MFGWDDAAAAVLKIIDKVIPDPQAKANAAFQLAQMKQAGEFKELEASLQRDQMQADINKEEAKSSSLFIAGWRPAFGWVCVAAFAWHFVGAPFLIWGAGIAGHVVPMPAVELGDLFSLMLGLLGLSGMRTYEKKTGTEGNR